MFSKVLIANRGEIAVRIARTCKELGAASVAVYSDADARARHVRMADEAVHLPGVAPADTYLNVKALVDAALSTGAEAVHPGYGFLSESDDLATAVGDAGLRWVGPPPEVLRLAGDKIQARRVAESAGVPVVPGLLDPIQDEQAVYDFAAEHGYPVAVKAADGGGGRGLKVASSESDVAAAYASARRESLAYFGSSTLYVERYLEAPKHLEVQILAPNPDEALWLGVRDCSLQRRHQKLIEETPPPRWSERASDMGEAAVALSKASGYVNAGTVEMLVTGGDFYFLEINARLQVEHTVTEEVFGIDIVACQLRIAAGEPLGLSQSDLDPRGHAIECRINAEDPSAGFVPSPGVITRYVEPNGLGVRVDSGYTTGDEVPAAYDSLVAKVVTWGDTRDAARKRMLRALDETTIEGVETTISAHKLLLENPLFREGTHTTATLETAELFRAPARHAGDVHDDDHAVLMVEGRAVRLWNTAMASSAPAGTSLISAGDIVAPMQGTVVSILVREGEAVEAGRPLVVLEAMKMETTVSAPRSGTVTKILVSQGETVGAGRTLAVLD